MTLEEAIKINQQIRIKYWDDFSNSELHASSLGIEALKLVQRQSPNRTLLGTELLPGETED